MLLNSTIRLIYAALAILVVVTAAALAVILDDGQGALDVVEQPTPPVQAAQSAPAQGDQAAAADDAPETPPDAQASDAAQDEPAAPPNENAENEDGAAPAVSAGGEPAAQEQPAPVVTQEQSVAQEEATGEPQAVAEAPAADSAEEQQPPASDELPPSDDTEQPAAPAAGTVPDPEVAILPGAVLQGETALVQVTGVAGEIALLTVEGFTSRMVKIGDVWTGYHPTPPLTPPGEYRVIVDLFDADSVYLTTRLGLLTVLNAQPGIEEIITNSEDAALLAPEIVAIDNEVRFVRHVAVSGPPRWSGPWLLPVAGEHNGPFGILRSYNGAPPSDWHHGHDIAAQHGDSINAPAAGLVVFADELPVHGMGVILDHGAGVYSGYWHMSAVLVAEGQLVEPADLIGRIGDTGLSVGPHLHWEVIVHGRDVDPLQWTRADLTPAPPPAAG